MLKLDTVSIIEWYKYNVIFFFIVMNLKFQAKTWQWLEITAKWSLVVKLFDFIQRLYVQTSTSADFFIFSRLKSNFIYLYREKLIPTWNNRANTLPIFQVL